MSEQTLTELYAKKRALVVDAPSDMRASFISMLRRLGCQHIDLARDGEEAVRLCAASRYDLVICDYGLGGGKNGQQVLEELRYTETLSHSAIFILLTSETSRKNVFGALEAKPDEYLAKPVNLNEFQRRLDKIVSEKEYFFAVNQALDKSDFERAVELIDGLSPSQPQYQNMAKQLKGFALLRANKFTQAAAYYRQLIVTAPAEWALVGYARALSGATRWDAAHKILSELYRKGARSLELFDVLTDTELELGNLDAAQALLEEATDCSPNAILRQALLGSVARENCDYPVSEKAYRRVIKLAVNSCYNSCEHSFGLIRCLLDKSAKSDNKQHPAFDEAQAILLDIKQKFAHDDGVCLQADMLGVSIAVRKGYLQHAREACEGIYRRYLEMDSHDPLMGLDMAAAFSELNEREKAQAVLADLAVRFSNSSYLMRRVDALSDTPLTREAKANAIEINKQGKALFASKQYAEAVAHFREACAKYPKNVALKLNWVLSLLQYARAEEGLAVVKASLGEAATALASLEKMQPDNPAYKRYCALRMELKKTKLDIEHAQAVVKTA